MVTKESPLTLIELVPGFQNKPVRFERALQIKFLKSDHVAIWDTIRHVFFYGIFENRAKFPRHRGKRTAGEHDTPDGHRSDAGHTLVRHMLRSTMLTRKPDTQAMEPGSAAIFGSLASPLVLHTGPSSLAGTSLYQHGAFLLHEQLHTQQLLGQEFLMDSS